MTYKTGFATLICAASVFLAGQALSQEGDKSGANGERAAGATTQLVQDAGLAQQLAQWGRSHNNAAALAVASQILSGASTQAMPESATGKTSEGASGDAEPKPAVDYTPDGLMAEANELAGDSGASMVAAIAESSASSRGDITGPNNHCDRVNAGCTDLYTITFRGGEVAEVAIIGDGDTDLDLRIYDENGNLICSDLDSTDRCFVRWTPRWTGKFSVRIQNLGNVYNAYTLLTN